MDHFDWKLHQVNRSHGQVHLPHCQEMMLGFQATVVVWRFVVAADYRRVRLRAQQGYLMQDRFRVLKVYLRPALASLCGPLVSTADLVALQNLSKPVVPLQVLKVPKVQKVWMMWVVVPPSCRQRRHSHLKTPRRGHRKSRQCNGQVHHPRQS